jgi:hypothetical protein
MRFPGRYDRERKDTRKGAGRTVACPDAATSTKGFSFPINLTKKEQAKEYVYWGSRKAVTPLQVAGAPCTAPTSKKAPNKRTGCTAKKITT